MPSCLLISRRSKRASVHNARYCVLSYSKRARAPVPTRIAKARSFAKVVSCDGNLRKESRGVGARWYDDTVDTGQRRRSRRYDTRATLHRVGIHCTPVPGTATAYTNLTVGVKSGLYRTPMIRLRCISCFPRPRASACAQATPSHAATPALLILLYPSPCGCSKPHHLAHHTDLKSMSPWQWLPRPQPSHLLTCHSLPCACVMPPRAWRVGAQTTPLSAAVAASAALRAL